MPFSLPSGALTRTNFALTLKSFIDGIESSLNTVTARVTATETKANAAYVKPSGGIPVSDVVSTFFRGLRITFLYNGTSYLGPDGVAATPTNSAAGARTPGTYRDYVSNGASPDPNALGIMIDGDAWDATA